MLWVLKRIVSMRRFFWALLKLMGKKIFTILRLKMLFIWTYVHVFAADDIFKFSCCFKKQNIKLNTS